MIVKFVVVANMKLKLVNTDSQLIYTSKKLEYINSNLNFQ